MHRGVRRTGLALDVDEQLEDAVVAAVDPAALAPGPIDERVEVERLQRAGRVDVLAVVRDEELAVDEPDVGFDAREAVGQGVLQRAVVLVVVVGVGLGQGAHPCVRSVRGGGRGCRGCRRGEGEEGHGEEGREQCARGPRHDVEPIGPGRTAGDRTRATRRMRENSRLSRRGVTHLPQGGAAIIRLLVRLTRAVHPSPSSSAGVLFMTKLGILAAAALAAASFAPHAFGVPVQSTPRTDSDPARATLVGWSVLPPRPTSREVRGAVIGRPATPPCRPPTRASPCRASRRPMRCADGSFLVMSDNGFGARANSADFELAVHRIRPNVGPAGPRRTRVSSSI